MAMDTRTARELLGYVDNDQGQVDRRIFSDPAIYQLEMEQIFARAWNFMAHDSMIPNTGDFVMTTIGDDRVIVVRDDEGNPQVLLNSCRHRGNAVCRAEEGNTTSFMCTYHGWTYDLKGKLVGVPGFKEVYHEELDRDAWGLVSAAKVERYKGFIFATMDGDAPPLYDYLGEGGRIGIDLLTSQGELVMVAGIQKYTLPCNWKLAADNVWDWYHPDISHGSAFMSGYGRRRNAAPGEPPNAIALNPWAVPHLTIPGPYGHAISGPTTEWQPMTGDPAFEEPWRDGPDAKANLGMIGLQSRGHPQIFPNMWITTGNQISMRFPKGPTQTEVWWFTILPADLTADVRNAKMFRANHTFGPAGMLEQDDGENWGESTKAARGVVSTRFPLNYQMAINHNTLEDDEAGPPRIFSPVSEHAQRWYYRAWAEWMAAPNWAALKESALRPEDVGHM